MKELHCHLKTEKVKVKLNAHSFIHHKTYIKIEPDRCWIFGANADTKIGDQYIS